MDIGSDSTSSEEHLDRSTVPLLHRLATLKLRHLHQVVGCNIAPPPGHSPPQPPPCLPARITKQPLQSGYFLSLHASCSPGCPPFLTTELMASSCPLWDQLHVLANTSNSVQTSKGFVARVWFKPPASSSSIEQKTPVTSGPDIISRAAAVNRVDTTTPSPVLGHSRASSDSAAHKVPPYRGSPRIQNSESSTTNQNACPPGSNREALQNQTQQEALSNRVGASGNCDNNVKSSQSNNFLLGNSSRRSSSYNPSTSQNLYRVSSRSSKSPPEAVNIGGFLVPPDPKGFSSQSGLRQSPPAVLVFSWAVRLSGLVPVGSSVSQAAPGLAPNTLLFQMTGSDLFYTAADCILPSKGSTSCVPAAGVDGLNMRRLWYGLSLPMSQTKRSYTPALLTRLHQTERDVVIIERQCQQRRDRCQYISSSFVKGSKHWLLQKQVAAVHTRLSISRTVVEREKVKRDALKRRLDELEDMNQEKGMHVMALLQQLSRDRQQLRASCNHTEKQMQQLQRVRALLAHRRACLVRDLAQVYPIVQISPKDDFSISNLWIPDAKFNNQNNLKTPSFQPTPCHRAKSVKSSSSRNSASSSALSFKAPVSQVLPDRSNTPASLGFDKSLSLALKSPNLRQNESSPNQFSQSLPQSSAPLASGSSPSSSTSSLSSTPRSATDSVPRTNQTSSPFSPTSVRGNPSMAASPGVRCSPLHPPFHPYPDFVYAPSSTSALPHSNESLSAGLGMAAHLLCLVSGLLQVPLRYPVSPAGSMATITDVASTQLQQDNRKFPLYTRGKEREKLHFNYALFLLNKNIAQLHQYLGRPKPSSLPSLLHNLYTAVIHLSRPERPLTESLPDLRCHPLLTPLSNLWSEPLLPVLPPPTPASSLAGAASADLNQVAGARTNAIPIPPSSSASSLLRSPQKSSTSSSRHYRSHSQSILVTSSSQSLAQSSRHSSFSKSSSPSHSNVTDHLQKSVSVSARTGFSPPPPPLPPASGDACVPISSSLGDLVAGYGNDEHRGRSSSSHGFSRDGQSFDRSQGYVTGRNLDGRTAGRSPLRSLNRNVEGTSQVSCSLDKGLDHIKDVVNNAKDIEIFVGKDSGLVSNEDLNKDTYVEKAVRPKPVLKTTTGSLTNLTKDKSLIVVSESIDFEDPSLARYEDHTTCLLRSWHEDNAVSYTGDFATCGSTEQLEEVGVEVTEGFMKDSEDNSSVKFELGACVDSTDDDDASADYPQKSSPSNSSRNEGTAQQDATNSPKVYPAASSLQSLDAGSEKKPDHSVQNRMKNSEKESKKNSAPTKSKSRSFWPFSRSNTSDESSRESNNTSEKFSSLDSSSRLGSLEHDDANSNHSRTPSESRQNSLQSNNLSSGKSGGKPPIARQHQVSPTAATQQSSSGSTAPTPASPPSSQTSVHTQSATEGDVRRESALSDELLKQSLAALSKDGCCSTDLSNLSDLTEVADRTAKLASKTFSFKMGTK